MSTEAKPIADRRLEEILNLIAQLASGDLSARGRPSERGDALDRIITGLNRLAEERCVWNAAGDQAEQRLNHALNEQLKQEIEERQRVGQELRQSEARLILAIAGTGGALWDQVLDPDATFDDQPDHIYLSPWAKRLLGYEDDELPNSLAAWDRHVVVEDRAPREQRQRDHFEGRTEFLDHDYRVRCKDGSIRWIHGRSRIMRDEHGAPIRWIGIDWDITQRKQAHEELQRYRAYLEDLVQERTAELSQANEQLRQEIAERGQAEEALRESESRWRSLTENSPDHIVTLDTDLNIEFANYASPGLTVEELIGTPLYAYVTEERQSEIKGILEHVLKTGEAARYETEFDILDRSTICYESHAVPRILRDKVVGLVVSARDITERVQAEEALRRGEEQVRTFLESVDDMVYFQGLDGSLSMLNTANAKVTGYSLEEFAANPQLWQEIVHPDDLKVAEEFFATYPDGTPSFEVEYRIRSKCGEWRWIHSRMVGVRDASGRYIGYNCIDRDITERVEAQAEREALIVELEAKNSELERFAYTISHDLKSPLVTIQGFLGFLKQYAQAGDTQHLLADIERISRATDKMSQLLDELLELSRIGRIVNPPQPVDLGELAREAVSSVAGRLTERGAEVEIAPNLPLIHGDRPRLREVLENLLDNAVKFMGDQAQPRVEIGSCDQDGETVIYIRDNGMGIEPRYQDRVFGLFEKLDADSEGSGVGLAVVQRIVEVHGGRVWVESSGPGQGSTFYFTIPQPGASQA